MTAACQEASTPTDAATPPLGLAFATARDHYFYDTNTNRLLKISPALFETITGLQHGDNALGPATGFAQLQSLRRQGLLLSEGPFVFSPLRHRHCIAHKQRHELSQLTLEVTAGCNLRCRYCVYGGHYSHQRDHGTAQMASHVIDRALGYFFAHNDLAPTISIGFYGNEPLLAFERIRYAAERVYGYKRGRDAHLHMTTNGTLLTREKFPFLVEHGFALLVSVDGPPADHDRNRVTLAGRGTFASILTNLAALKNYAPGYYEQKVAFNAVLTPTTSMDRLRRFFTTHPLFRGQRVQANAVNPGSPEVMEALCRGVSECDRSALSAEATSQLEDYLSRVVVKQRRGSTWDFLQNTCASALVRFHRRPLCNGPKAIASLNGMCIPGWRKLFVDVRGCLFTCERVGRSWPIGDVQRGFDEEGVFGYLRQHAAFTQRCCRRCWALRLCGACQATIGGPDGIDAEKVKTFCDTERGRHADTIRMYVEILEEARDAFDYIEDIHVS